MTESVEKIMNELITKVFCVDDLLNKTMKEYSEGKLEYGDENFEKYQNELKELKEKWEVKTYMMIVGKYFETNNDYINVMKLNSRYRELTQMYHFNPIPDTSLFENMETQYVYEKGDKLKEGIEQHVYWYQVDYEEVKNKNTKDEYKRFELNSKTMKKKKKNSVTY